MSFKTEIGSASATEAFYCTNYAVQAGTDGPIKIGRSVSIKLRLYQLQQACPYKLITIGYWPSTERHEKRIHDDLAPHRLRGEWYYPTEPVLTRIKAEMAASDAREPARVAFVENHIRSVQQPGEAAQ